MPATLASPPYAVTDRADSTLGAPMSNVATTLEVAVGSGAKFPVGNFILWIEDERVHVATRTGDTFSGLSRGFGNTTPAAHASGVYCHLCFGETVHGRTVDNLMNHTHPEADITGLVADLAGKAPVSHAHAASEITSGVLAPDRLAAGSALQVVRRNAGNAALEFATPSGGSDPWAYVRVTSADFTTTSASAQNVTGLAFTPAANTDYEFEAILMVRTATATVNPRTGLAWPTGLTDGVAQIASAAATAVGTPFFVQGNPNAALLIPAGGLPNTTQSWPVILKGMLRAGASPSGNLQLQLASETAGTTVRVVVGSFLRYRTIP